MKNQLQILWNYIKMAFWVMPRDVTFEGDVKEKEDTRNSKTITPKNVTAKDTIIDKTAQEVVNKVLNSKSSKSKKTSVKIKRHYINNGSKQLLVDVTIPLKRGWKKGKLKKSEVK